MAEGTQTPSLPLSDSIAELIGNAAPGGVTATVRILIDKLSAQLAASGPLASKIIAAEAGLVETTTWPQLAAIAGTRAGQVGQAIGPDAGTHTDPVVGGTVANKGRYSWSVSPAGWRRTGNYVTVSEEISAIVAGAPDVLDTLNEIAEALGDDPNFAVTMTNALAALSETVFEQTVAHVPGYDSDEPGSFIDVSADGYILQGQLMEEEYDTDEAAPVAAISLDGYELDELGFIPALPAVVNADQIRRLRQKLRMKLRDSTQVCRLALLGDSWFASYIGVVLRDRLVSIYGDAGPGWVNFADSNNNKSADSRIIVSKSGTWTDVIGYEPMPSTTALETSEVGAYINIFGVGPIATSWLHYVLAVGAAAEYRWGSYNSGDRSLAASYTFGSDQALDLSTGYRIDMPTGRPSGIGANDNWALQIECTAGTIKIGGVDLRSGTGGVIVDSLAKGGSNTDFWLIPDKAKWQTAVGSLDIDGTVICLGTNDQAGIVTNKNIARNFDAIRQRLVGAEPAQDVIYVSPCENFLGRPRLMKDITAAVREIALYTGTPHIDLQPAFGPVSKMYEYRSTGVRPLFNVDDVHPDSFTGMVVIADQIERLLIQ